MTTQTADAVGAVIDRWYRAGLLRFNSRDDGSDDLLLRDEIVRAVKVIDPYPPNLMTPLDPDRLATAMIAAFRDLAKSKWPWLAGDGWPAYSERVKGHDMSQVFIVNEIAEAVALEYEATPTAEDLHPAAEWNLAE